MAILGKSKREALTEFRRAEILAAARTVFADRGYREATLDDIANTAEVAKGTVYLYFSSKEEIFSAALLGYFEEMLAASRAAVGAAQTIEDKLRAAIRVRFEFLCRNEQFLRIYFTEFGSLCAHPGALQKDFRQLYLRAARMLEPVIAGGVRNGTLRRVPALETAMALMEMIRTTVALHLLGMHEHEFDLEQFVFDLFWRGIASAKMRHGVSPTGTERGPAGRQRVTIQRAMHDEMPTSRR